MVSMHFELILAAASDSEARLTRCVEYGDASHGTKCRKRNPQRVEQWVTQFQDHLAVTATTALRASQVSAVRCAIIMCRVLHRHSFPSCSNRSCQQYVHRCPIPHRCTGRKAVDSIPLSDKRFLEFVQKAASHGCSIYGPGMFLHGGCAFFIFKLDSNQNLQYSYQMGYGLWIYQQIAHLSSQRVPSAPASALLTLCVRTQALLSL